MSRLWKGKARAEALQPEGSGGAEGIVLPLQVTGTGVYDMYVVFSSSLAYSLLFIYFCFRSYIVFTY